jgi:hypothetical protein
LLASAEAMPRTRPAAEFALVNHILISGFFFNQGFAMLISFETVRPDHQMAVGERKEYD